MDEKLTPLERAYMREVTDTTDYIVHALLAENVDRLTVGRAMRRASREIDKDQNREGTDARSGELFGISVASEEGFRSQPGVNTDEDMIRVKLDMPKPTRHKLKKHISEGNNGGAQ